MTQGIYNNTLSVIGELVDFFDNEPGINQLEDAGLAIEGIALTTADGERYVGHIYFDESGHPYFQAAD